METVGAYRLLRQIGEGGMGVVHLALAPDGSRVAVKILRPHVIGGREARQRLEREVAAMRRVRSPRVAECVDAEPWGEPPYVVTQYVAGLSLTEYVAEYGPLSGDGLHRLALGTAEALASVHASGVLHRDVKPSNVLLDRGEPVLIDFGLAMSGDESRMTHAGWVFGTPAYLAPEVVLGDAPTPAVDVHGWAATVAFAATGRSPYGSGPSVVVLDRIRRGAYELAGVPEPVAGILARCLEPHPHERPTAAELCRWLEQVGASAAGSGAYAAAAGAASQPTYPRSAASMHNVGHPLGEPTTAVAGAGRTIASHAGGPSVGRAGTAGAGAAAPPGAPGGAAALPSWRHGTDTAPSPSWGTPRDTGATRAHAGSMPSAAGAMPPGAHSMPLGAHASSSSALAARSGAVTPSGALAAPPGTWPSGAVASPWPPVETSTGTQVLQWACGLAAAAALAGLVAIAPYLTALAVVALVVVLRAGVATGDRRRRLVQRRGPRGRDGFVGALLWPVQAVLALPVAALACLVAMVGAIAVSAMQSLLTPGPDASTVLGGVVFTALLWLGPADSILRRAGAGATRLLLTPPAAGVVTLLVLAATALVVLVLAYDSPTMWFPGRQSPWRVLGG